MKYFAAVFFLLCVQAAFAITPLEALAGSYRAILFSEIDDSGIPLGLLELQVTKQGSVSGKLITDSKKTISFRSTIAYTEKRVGELKGLAASPEIPVNSRSATLRYLKLEIKDLIKQDRVEARLYDQGEITPIGSTINGFKCSTIRYIPGTTPYTAAFELSDEVLSNTPKGSGYAVGRMSKAGVMKLTGKLGDGTPFTAALPNGEKRQLALFINPYRREGSYFAGSCVFTNRALGVAHAVGGKFYWKKEGGEKDKSYRAGFGPLPLKGSIQPWFIPEKNETISDLCRLDDYHVFSLNQQQPSYDSYFPTTLTLTSNNKFKVTSGNEGSPSAFEEAQWLRLFKGQVNPQTGRVTARLHWNVPPSGPLRERQQTVFEGVMLAPEFQQDRPTIHGFSQIPKANKKAEVVYNKMHFTANTLNPWIQSAAPTAGIYTGMFIHHSTTSPITEAPIHESFITLNLSEDLRTLEFANNTLALIADKRPLSLQYMSQKARPQISLTLNLNESSQVWNFEGLYTQGPKKLLFTSGEDSITKHEGPLLFLGDSITAAWEQFPSIWNAAFSAYRPINYAVPGYTTDDIERDIRAGRLDDLHPKAIVLLIGTNNFYRDNVEKVTQKIPRLLQSIRAKAPHAQIILLGILPRGEKSNDPFRPLITATNKVTATLDNDWNIHYLDFGAAYLNPDGSLIEGVMPDFLHLSGTGYQIWADQMAALLHAVMTNSQIP